MADIHSLGGLPRGELRALWIRQERKKSARELADMIAARMKTKRD